jgi:2-octaprenyl-6-methoxyphenol hydroxylase
MIEDKYSQNAVVLNIKTEVHHNGRAFERFATDGPLAFLPLSRSRTAVVWTRPERELGRSMSLDEIAFRDELQNAFGHRLGKLTRIGARSSYPLARVRSKQRVGDRVVLVGNAAVSLHPVAGQAFNIALRDVAVLAEIINEERASQGLQADIGGSELLARYDELRRNDQRRVAAFTHALIRLFGCRGWPVAITRALGLMAFDLMPGAKAQLARHTMGLAGRLPRLARGLRAAND